MKEIKLKKRQESELVNLIDQFELVWRKKHLVYNGDQIARFERTISNLLYEFSIIGFPCGLKSKGLIIPKGKSPTYDHVYSRKLVSKYLMDEYIKEPITIEKLKEILPPLLTSIILSKEDNKKLSTIVKKKKYTLKDLMKMKHYKKANISLEYKNGNGYYRELVTEEMNKLIGLNNTNSFWDDDSI